MKTPTRIIPIICLGLLVLLIPMLQVSAAGIHSSPYSTLADTPAFSIPIVVYPNGLYNTYGINFGIHAGATKGIDASLGEVGYPPFPPGGAMAMFITPDDNAILDLRPYTSPAQIDTFTLGVSAETTSYPITVTWPDLHQYFGGSVQLKWFFNGWHSIDMKAQTSYVLTTGPALDMNYPPPFIGTTLQMYIIAEGPIAGTSMPVVSTYGVANGGFQAIVNAPTAGPTSSKSASGVAAGTTSVWFEYGPTKSYGTSTTPQTIIAGTSAPVTEPFNLGSLPPNTRIHFRSVAQNALGTFYGGDRVASNGTPAPEVLDTSGSVLYRTATYHDWADAKDAKGKRKSFKAQNDRTAFTIGVQCKTAGISDLTVEFGSTIDTVDISSALTVTPAAASVTGESKLKKWHIHWSSALTNGDSVHISGTAWGGKSFKISKYAWGSPAGKAQKDFRVTATPGLPMPNLHNIGEGIYGGVKQTAVVINVGVNDDPKGAHTVYHPKYADVLKSLVKEQGKAAALYHTKAPRWLNTFDKNGDDISKKQKGLPPDKHNNILFAEVLTLKLNVAASDSGIFPKGLGDLVYTNSTALDGETVREIIAEADTFLGGDHQPPLPGDVTDSSVFLKVVQDINTAFSGPIDTVSWSGKKVVCTGVKMLSEVTYLSASPTAVSAGAAGFAKGAGQKNTPLGFKLNQNFPNPFNPTTTISYQLPVESKVTLTVYNLLGQTMATLTLGQQQAGDQSVTWNAGSFSSGVYFYRLDASSIADPGKQFTQMKKMLLVK